VNAYVKSVSALPTTATLGVLRLAVTQCNTPQRTATTCEFVFQVFERLTHLRNSRCIATHRNTPQHTTTYCNTPHHTATHCNTLQRTATHCNTLQHTATTSDCVCQVEHRDSSSAKRTAATHCSTLQHTATHCNTLQRIAAHTYKVRKHLTYHQTLSHYAIDVIK